MAKKRSGMRKRVGGVGRSGVRDSGSHCGWEGREGMGERCGGVWAWSGGGWKEG